MVAAALLPVAWQALTMGSVQPQGWMQRELGLQIQGMAGNFAKFWEPINNTQWLGGTSTHEDWMEIFPYVLAGNVPAAILSNDTAQLAQVQGWLEYVLAHQSAQGWLGPQDPNVHDGMYYWPRWPVMLAFHDWYQYTGDMRFINASIAWMQYADGQLDSLPMEYEWTGIRWQDWIYVIQVYLDDPVTAPWTDFLTAHMQKVYAQGKAVIDWERTWYVDPADGGYFPTDAVPGDKCNLTNHGVNNGMAVKSGAMVYRMSGGDPLGRDSSLERMVLLDKYHGVPTGVFQADEHFAGLMPSHGTETCTVAELMLSYNVIHEALGDAIFAERAEVIAYNAMPGSMTKDLWARVYLQQMNEAISVQENDHVWISDGPDSIIYSLEGNYACCTSNFPQAWPRLIQRMLHASPDGGVALSVLGPVAATLSNGVSVNVSTDYPFGDDVNVYLTNLPTGLVSLPVYVRIPNWATSAAISINGGTPYSVGQFAGSMYRVPLAGVYGPAVAVTLLTNPSIRIETGWFNNALSVHRGALVYALQLQENFTVLRANGLESFDYAITQPSNTTIAWNSALVVDPSAPDRSMTFTRLGPVPDMPYSSLIASNVIFAQARSVAAWGFQDGSAAPPPNSPVDCSAAGACGPIVNVTLVPYGTTHLRITEIPWIQA